MLNVNNMETQFQIQNQKNDPQQQSQQQQMLPAAKPADKFSLWLNEEKLIISFRWMKDFVKKLFDSEEELMDVVMLLVNTGYKVQ